MMLFRLLGPQGIAGLAVSICLGLLLVLQNGETRHWKKQSGQFEQLYHEGQTALAQTVANYRAAAEAARSADRAAAERVAAEQRAINERTEHDYQARLADARARAERLRVEARAAADPGGRAKPPVPSLPAAAGRPSQGPREDGLPDALTATEQAIQLDELIKWVKAQAGVNANTSN
jgi:hypothetical protein